MLGFPIPYSEELLYSTIARSGVHDGDVSPKQLLEKVFNNRRVIATVDLPSHVQAVANQYPDSLGMDAKNLIYRHTLWPIYAPFLPPDRSDKVIKWMSGSSQGAAHLASGIVASRVKTKGRLYVCVECLKEQRIKYGECFWERFWQIPIVNTCPKHGPLNKATIVIDGEHRHTFTVIEDAEVLGKVNATNVDKLFSHQVSQLMQVISQGISPAQWTVFYEQFASNLGYLNGLRIDHSRIYDSVIRFWGKGWLQKAGILPSYIETSWLKALFRKHRKSFSFAEHIVVITALSNGRFSICEAIDKASSIVIKSENNIPPKKRDLNTLNALSPDQIDWTALIEVVPPKAARLLNKALYARLYRNHYDWLMHINSLFHAEKVVVNNRVDWPQRDRQIAQNLRRVCKNLSEDLKAPHLSRTFLIHQLENRATVEKNLHRLPRSSHLLALYSESTDEYQARRLTRTYLYMLKNKKHIKRWSLLRAAGLSDERMTDIVSKLLEEILSE